jgi:hypothetical protein
MKVGNLIRLQEATANCWGIQRNVILVEKVLTADTIHQPWDYAWKALVSDGRVIEFGRQIEHSSELVG